MSTTSTSPQSPSGTSGRVTFQSTPTSKVNTNRPSNEGLTTPKLEEHSTTENFEKNMS